VLEAGIRRHPSDFWMHFELGWAYWFGKPQRLDLALGCFRTAVALRLNVAAAWHFLTAATAEKAKMAGRTSEPDAIAALKERVKANPDDFAVRRELGLLLFNNTRDYAGAAEVFRELTLCKPETAEYHHLLGEALRWANRIQESVATHRVAVRLAPETPRHNAHLGIVLSLNGEHEEAIRQLLQAINHPTDPQKYGSSHLADAYEAAGMITEAVAAYRNAVRYFAFNYHDWQRLSNVAYKAKDFETSATAAREAMRLEPGQSYHPWRLDLALEALGDTAGAASAHRQDGILCRITKRPDHAVTCFQRAIALTPHDATLFHEIAVTHLENGNLPAADTAAQDALRLDSNLAPAYAIRGDIARRQRRFADSLTAYETAVRLAPADLGYLHSRAAAFHNFGRVAEAEAGYRDVLRQNPDREQTLLNLGNLLRLKGDPAGSVTVYREVIRVNPKLPAAYINLAFAYRMHGRLPEAVAAMRKAVEIAPNDATTRPQLAFVEKLLVTEHALPAVLAGTKQLPEADAFTYSQFCLMARPGKFALAFRLYAGLPELKFPHAYNAACAAVLLAAGRDPSVSEVSLDEWYYLMGRALEWMAADLAQFKSQLADPNPQRQASAKANLRHHLADPDLAPVRDPGQIKLMPDPDERAKWERFWADLRRTADDAGVSWRELAPAPHAVK